MKNVKPKYTLGGIPFNSKNSIMQEDDDGDFVKQEDASFTIQYLELDKRRLVEALQILTSACEKLEHDGGTQFHACFKKAEDTLALHQFCYMCHADKPKGKKWVEATHGGRVFCSNNCINNYASGADLT